MDFRPSRDRASLPAFAFALALALALLASITATGCSDDGGPNDPDQGVCGHVEADGARFVSHGKELARDEGEVATGELSVREGALLHMVEFHALDGDGDDVLLPGPTCDSNFLAYTVENSAIAQIEREDGQKWAFNVRGIAQGQTTVTFRPMHEDHFHYETQAIRIVVTAP